MAGDRDREGLAWQVGVWDRMSDVYLQAIDVRVRKRRARVGRRRERH